MRLLTLLRGVLSTGFSRELAAVGTFLAVRVTIKKTQKPMEKENKILMKYLYHHVWKEKYVTLTRVADWTRTGKYEHRVEAVRGLREVAALGGMVNGQIAAEV